MVRLVPTTPALQSWKAPGPQAYQDVATNSNSRRHHSQNQASGGWCLWRGLINQGRIVFPSRGIWDWHKIVLFSTSLRGHNTAHCEPVVSLFWRIALQIIYIGKIPGLGLYPRYQDALINYIGSENTMCFPYHIYFPSSAFSKNIKECTSEKAGY